MVETPGEIDYQTPNNLVVSPRDVLSPGGPRRRSFDREVLSISSNSSSEDEDEAPEIPLSWEGHSRLDLIALFGSARSHASHDTLMIHNLQARSELLKFYDELGMNEQEVAAFMKVLKQLKTYLALPNEKKNRFERA